jgi:hypothetical protein
LPEKKFETDEKLLEKKIEATENFLKQEKFAQSTPDIRHPQYKKLPYIRHV